MTCLMNASASAMFSARSANATSGSIIQNSARCRGVSESSARNVGPNVYTLLSAQAWVSASSWPETVRKAGRLKKSSA